MNRDFKPAFYRAWIIILVSLILVSCDNTNDEFENNLKQYLQIAHKADLNEALYILIPSNSCNGCKLAVYRNLLSARIEKQIKLIVVGEAREALTVSYLRRIEGKGIETLYDPLNKAESFGLISEEYPMAFIAFIDIEDNHISSVQLLKSNMINGEVDIRKEIFKDYIK